MGGKDRAPALPVSKAKEEKGAGSTGVETQGVSGEKGKKANASAQST